ncbi:MAG: VWA domain-containing protein [Candidatus Dojkabacteria bacterium]
MQLREPVQFIQILILSFLLVAFVYKLRKKRLFFLHDIRWLQQIVPVKPGWNISGKLLVVLRVVIIVFCALLIARPYLEVGHEEDRNGLDIMLTVDISRSMEDTDVAPSRLEATQRVISRFNDSLVNDRVGLAVFTGSAAQLTPLTFDYEVVDFFNQKLTENSMLYLTEPGGTAVGEAVVYSTERFDDREERTKIIILITDGESTFGIDPEKAAAYARSQNVKVYTIFVSSKNNSEAESMLQDVASSTDGQFFPVKDENSFYDVVQAIGEEERTLLSAQSTTLIVDHPNVFLGVVAVSFVLYIFIQGFKRML